MSTLKPHEFYDKMILVTVGKENWNNLYYLSWNALNVTVYWYEEDGLHDVTYDTKDVEEYIEEGSWKILAKREVE